jgi:cytochrome c556
MAGALALGMALISPALGAAQDDAAIYATMKKAGPAFGAVRKATEAMAADTVKENATVLSTVFTDTEAFFKTKGKADAVKWAQDAAKIAQTLAAQAGKADWEGAKKSATDLGASCATCHTAYRDKGPDGAYRLKPGN